jgi:hypothetical protein
VSQLYAKFDLFFLRLRKPLTYWGSAATSNEIFEAINLLVHQIEESVMLFHQQD